MLSSDCDVACGSCKDRRCSGNSALTVCYWQRGLDVRVGKPRRFRFSGPALVVPRLDDRVRPTPSATHRGNHPRQVRLTRAERGSGCSIFSRTSTAARSFVPSPSSIGAAADVDALHRQQLTSINTHRSYLRHPTAPSRPADWLWGISTPSPVIMQIPIKIPLYFKSLNLACIHLYNIFCNIIMLPKVVLIRWFCVITVTYF